MDPRLEEIDSKLAKEIERRRREGNAFEMGDDLRTIIEILARLEEEIAGLKRRVELRHLEIPFETDR